MPRHATRTALHAIGPARPANEAGQGTAFSLQRRLDDAEALAERLTMTLESMTDCFFTLDRSWRFTYLNREAERVLRRTRSALLGEVIWDCLPDTVGSTFQTHYLRAMERDVPVEFDTFYAPLETWLHVRAYPSSQGLAISFRDNTERVRAQREILNMNAELEERVKQRTDELQAATAEMEAFSYSVAHDLRAPLGAINGYSQALEEHEAGQISSRALHFLRRIRSAARQMDQMTDGLLALARLSRAALRKEVLDLTPVADHALALLRERDPQRQVDVRVMHNLWAEGDLVLLTQVMTNLLANAWKFTAQTPHARIEVGMRHGGADYEPVYYVRDNGAGFDMAYAGKLFQVFHRLHATTEFEGTGVGLATVHKIISRHDGRIWAEAAPGKGATFFFTLGAASPGTALP